MRTSEPKIYTWALAQESHPYFVTSGIQGASCVLNIFSRAITTGITMFPIGTDTIVVNGLPPLIEILLSP